MALGGAFAARALDPSAIYFNPAGIAFQQRHQLYIGVTGIFPRSAFYGPFQFNTNEKTEMVNRFFTPLNAYGTYHISNDLHVGIGVYNAFGLGTKWPETWSGRFITTSVDLQSFFISPTIAYRVSENFSLGVGVNYVMGNVTIRRVVSDPFDPHATLRMDLDATSWGFNVGALYRFSDDLSVGLSYRSQIKLRSTGTANFSPDRPVYPEGNVKSSIILPAIGYLGVSYSPIPDLVLEADFQYVGWSSYKKLVFEFEKDGSTVTSPTNYRDTFILRFGAEYDYGDWQLRAGYLFDRTPVENRYVDPLLPDANRNGLSLGFGYRLSDHLALDMAYMFIKFDQRRVENTEVNFDGTYSSDANLFSIDLSYSF